MWNLNDIIRINYIENYTFHIIFDDGVQGDVDFSGYIEKGPVFEPLKDKNYFRKAFLEGGTISWPNGADIAPESLYNKILQTSKTAVK
ncbi:MAG: DUF2442 domain-containing protein [Chlorobiaceae bacterium]|jgi:hypothetical protein|nr:DUF2442 domain-containing protein [Chlorobiaceae bacterium]